MEWLTRWNLSQMINCSQGIWSHCIGRWGQKHLKVGAETLKVGVESGGAERLLIVSQDLVDPGGGQNTSPRSLSTFRL